MAKPKLRVVSYVRNMALTKNKFVEFDKMIREAKGTADAVMVVAPEVLGDNYDELVDNLNEIAATGLHLVIMPPDERGTKQRPFN